MHLETSQNNRPSQRHFSLLLAVVFCLGLSLIGSGYAVLDHDCNHRDSAHCALCGLAFSLAEETIAVDLAPLPLVYTPAFVDSAPAYVFSPSVSFDSRAPPLA
jgi:hypothetical protein